MNSMIDLNSELIIDRSTIRNPYLRLLLTAIGQDFASGSPWVAVNKTIASQYNIEDHFLIPSTLDAPNWARIRSPELFGHPRIPVGKRTVRTRKRFLRDGRSLPYR